MAFFGGNVPTNAAPSIFNSTTRLYYLPGTTGWGTTFGGSSQLILWNPKAQTGDGHFGVQAGQFGFNITGTANIPCCGGSLHKFFQSDVAAGANQHTYHWHFLFQ